MAKARVLAAMSGGVDSSVAAALLKKDGYEVIGATMKIWPNEQCGKDKEKKCCSLKDIEDAKKVCNVLGIRHYVLNFEKIFKKEIIDYFTREYMSGRTPNPCIVCNEKVKFGRFLEKANELGCDFIATGHYAIIEGGRLRQAVDKSKDQSYVLFSLTRERLKKVLFPIGRIPKSKVRKIAKNLKLPVHEKQDSQELCFVPGNNYSDFLREACGIEDKEGDIINGQGKVIGNHKGFWNFTIGQRKGLCIAHTSPLYVIEISPEKNIIVVGESKDVKKSKFVAGNVSYIDPRDKGIGTKKIEVKVRYAHKKEPAFVRDIGNKKVEVEFKNSQETITRGQAAVFYEEEYVIGGGWIEKVIS